MQALILAGGQGTRLRPLTSTIPKPVVPLAGRPHLAHMIDWLRGHGVDEVVISCGFMADDVRAVLGAGADLGVALSFAEEPEPRGTAGAIKFAEDQLRDRFLVLNGDVLCDMDLTAQLAQHEATGARATLALIGVDDPSAYGLVRIDDDRAVREFLEKPTPDQIDTNLINAGGYILERDVLDLIAPGENVSIEREVFPRLIGEGLYGFPQESYWIDIGSPERYLQASFDILEGRIDTAAGPPDAAGLRVAQDAVVAGHLTGPVLVGPGASIATGAQVGPRAVLGPGVSVGREAVVESSVVLDGTRIADGAVVRGAIVSRQVTVGPGVWIDRGAVVGAGAQIGAGSKLGAQARIFPGVNVPEASTLP